MRVLGVCIASLVLVYALPTNPTKGLVPRLTELEDKIYDEAAEAMLLDPNIANGLSNIENVDPSLADDVAEAADVDGAVDDVAAADDIVVQADDVDVAADDEVIEAEDSNADVADEDIEAEPLEDTALYEAADDANNAAIENDVYQQIPPGLAPELPAEDSAINPPTNYQGPLAPPAYGAAPALPLNPATPPTVPANPAQVGYGVYPASNPLTPGPLPQLPSSLTGIGYPPSQGLSPPLAAPANPSVAANYLAYQLALQQQMLASNPLLTSTTLPPPSVPLAPVPPVPAAPIPEAPVSDSAAPIPEAPAPAVAPPPAPAPGEAADYNTQTGEDSDLAKDAEDSASNNPLNDILQGLSNGLGDFLNGLSGIGGSSDNAAVADDVSAVAQPNIAV